MEMAVSKIRSGRRHPRSKILYVGPEDSYEATGEENVVDAQGGTILPGFIDTHVHMMMEYTPLSERLTKPFSYMYLKRRSTLKIP